MENHIDINLSVFRVSFESCHYQYEYHLKFTIPDTECISNTDTTKD